MNALSQRSIPWEIGCDAPDEEIDTIVASLQAWQLGETSDGSHLFRAASHYAEGMKDPLFLEVVKLFIQEEQRHGEMLGRFLDLAKRPRIKRNWGDSIFRYVRYSFENLEIWATPVVMIETMALIYYRALHDATRSRVLRAICRQILHDEVPHIRFQYERLAVFYRNRSRCMRLIVALCHRFLFLAVCLAVWVGHARTFKAGGHSFYSYLVVAWRRMNRAWRGMNPSRYNWVNFDKAKDTEISAAADLLM